jgi:arylsulfatase A-like enzyme/Tfp pilus assembly protein PilF
MNVQTSSRRRPLVLGPALLGLAFLLVACAPRAAPKRASLLLVTVDTLRADRLGCYSGRYVATPEIDGLAEKGVIFERAFSHSTTTLPSHACILLGTTPLAHGVHDNANFVVPPEALTLAEHLKFFGYATAAFIGGYPLVSRFGLNQGFDAYDDRLGQGGMSAKGSGTRRAEDVLAAALSWLRTAKAPWFVWVHLWDPHDPYAPPEPYGTRYAGRPYDGEVAYTDSSLGVLFRFLKETGLADSTVVVLTGDHGESLGEHGEKTHGLLAYNATLHIPLVVAGPGLGHRVVSAPVSHVDIFPTVCDLLGVAKPGTLQGASLVPALKGGSTPAAPIYFESLSAYYNMNWAPLTGFIGDGQKYIDSPVPEIYDLARDFGETDNLAGQAEAAKKKEALDALVRARSSTEAAGAARSSDRATIEKLRSLGYTSGFRSVRQPGPERFRPEDDVKSMLPFFNRASDALALYEAGKVREAVAEAEAVIRDRPNISTAYLHLAHFYKDRGRLAEAVAVLKRGLAAMPGNYYIYLEAVTDLYEAGEYDQALRVFGQGPPQAELDPLVWNYAGLAWLKKGDEASAKSCFDKALVIDGESAVTWYNLGNLHYFAFERSGDRARLKQAAECEDMAVALDPANASAHYVLGVVRFQDQDDAGALLSLEKALALDPGLSSALYYLGLSWMRKGEPAKACPYLRKYRDTPDFAALTAEEKAAINDLIARCSRHG